MRRKRRIFCFSHVCAEEKQYIRRQFVITNKVLELFHGVFYNTRNHIPNWKAV